MQPGLRRTVGQVDNAQDIEAEPGLETSRRRGRDSQAAEDSSIGGDNSVCADSEVSNPYGDANNVIDT